MAEPSVNLQSATQALPLPWQTDMAERLRHALEADRLAHALLVCGPAGVGKRRLVEWLVSLLLCESRHTARPCRDCRGCSLMDAGSHPDFRFVEPESGSLQIRIDAIRELTEFINLSSQLGARRIAVIAPADRLNRHAANSLLKTLEEPPPGAQLIMLADHVASLPSTVRSRCQRITVAPPGLPVARRWLREQGAGESNVEQLLAISANAPLRALAFAEQEMGADLGKLTSTLADISRGRRSPLDGTGEWATREQLPQLLDLLTVLVQRLIRRESIREPDPLLPQLAEIPSGMELCALHRYLDYLYEAQRLRDRALQPQLYVEDLFVRWQHASSRRSHG